MRPRPLLVLVVAFLMGVAARAARAEVADSTGARERSIHVDLLPPRLTAGSVVLLPKLTYATETRLGVGGEILVPFRISGAESSLKLKGRLTATEKSDARLSITIGTRGSPYTLKTAVGYSSLPIRFYGIGPKTKDSAEELYEPQALDAYVEVLRRVAGPLELGVRVEVQQHRLIHVAPNGQLVARTIRGTTGRVISGTGLVFAYDTRDRRYSPTHGWYHQGYALVFDDVIGSEHDFNNSHLDLRRYDRVGPVIVASQVFWFSVRGSAPFWRYAALGGRAHTRGYRKGRYIDRELLSGQIELRRNLWRRVGGVFFGGVAAVAPRVVRMRLDTVRPTLGAGLRYTVGKADGVRAALDVAVGASFDAPRLYLGLDEAF